ncbi:MAG: MFS transporter [Candidatus Hermodarchaeota archaeon]
MLITRFLGINSLTTDAKKTMLGGTCVYYSSDFVFWLSSTFFILQALSVLTFAQLGLILALRQAVQGVLDYPTGVLGDWLSHRVVLFLSAISYSLSFVCFAIALDFFSFSLAFFLLAIATSQDSGTYQAWFDNNYKVYAYEDKEHQIYSEFMGKLRMIRLFVMASALPIGGILCSIFGRTTIFLIQSMTYILLALLFLRYLRDHPKLNHNRHHNRSDFGSYFSLLGDGLKISVGNKTLFAIIIGSIINQGIAGAIWGNFILFPMYESYGKTDEFIAFARAMLYLSLATLTGVAGIYIRRLSNTSARKLLSINMFTRDVLFYGGFVMLLVMFPPSDYFNLTSFLALITIGCFVQLAYCATNLLTQRLFLDLIPDKNRNSIYSLIPTFAIFLNIPALVIGGFLCEILEPSTVILLIMAISIIGSFLIGVAVLKYREIQDNGNFDR